jgi:site-specific recombinase XerD
MGECSQLYVIRGANPQDAPLVLTELGQLHLPLSLYSRYLSERYAKKTQRTYIRSLVTYFSWLGEQHDVDAWSDAVENVQGQILRYLLVKFACRVKSHRRGFRTVDLTKNNLAATSQFLAAARAFYEAMIAAKLFDHVNPLVGINSSTDDEVPPEPYPRMPHRSGVVPDSIRRRLTNAFFVVTNEQWTPQVIDDPGFPQLIFSAGERLGWKLRERLIVRLLFETGARISEICGLTLGDWLAHGANNSATSFSKGSSGRRVKFVRWSSSTTKLLRTYLFDERINPDGLVLRLSDYAPGLTPPEDPFSIPLFSTRQGTQLSPSSFRDLYWRPAMALSQIRAHIHQTRHWYVTMSIREIYSSGGSADEIERQTAQLIRYMNWRSGKSTLEAYEHFFDRQRHGEVQDRLHKKLEECLGEQEEKVEKVPSCEETKADSEFDYLIRLGGHLAK